MRIWHIFILVCLCSCKSKEIARSTESYERFTSDVSALNEQTKQDTTKTIVIEYREEIKVIEETIHTKIYDKDTGNLTEETETKRTIRQDIKTDKVESEDKGVNEATRDSTKQNVNQVKKSEISEKVKEESSWNGFAKSLGKWIGIGMVAILFLLMIWKGIKEKLLL